MATKDHWIVYVYDHARDEEQSMGYFDGTRAQAIKHFKSQKRIKGYMRPGTTITMKPNAIVLYDGYMANPKLRQKGNTKVIKGPGKELTVRLYATDIVKILADGSIQLNSGGHKTATTKRRMNEAADELQLYFKVFSKGGKWVVSTEDRLEPPQTIEYSDGMIISGPQHLRNPKRKRNVAKKRRTAKQRAATKKLIAFNKKRRKKKTKTARRKTTRRKVTRKVTRRKTKRNPHRGAMVAKKSHLFLIFKCSSRFVVSFLKPNTRTGKLDVWTKDKGKAILFKTKTQAKQSTGHIRISRSDFVGIAPSYISSAVIASDCKKQAGK